MTAKEIIDQINETLVNSNLPQEVLDYWNGMKTIKENKGLTETGLNVLNWMKENETQFNNIFNSKIIGEGLFMATRSVSGTMRKLITDGYATKCGQNPVTYSLTEKGKSFN